MQPLTPQESPLTPLCIEDIEFQVFFKLENYFYLSVCVFQYCQDTIEQALFLWLEKLIRLETLGS